MDIHSWIKDKSITEYKSYLTRLFLCLLYSWLPEIGHCLFVSIWNNEKGYKLKTFNSKLRERQRH